VFLRRRRLLAGAGGLIGAALARFIGHEHAKHLDQHLQHGGLLLWIRTRDADCEQRALEILRHHSARDVHLHQIPERACKESDVPRERPRVVHLLDREYSFDSLVARLNPDTGPRGVRGNLATRPAAGISARCG